MSAGNITSFERSNCCSLLRDKDDALPACGGAGLHKQASGKELARSLHPQLAGRLRGNVAWHEALNAHGLRAPPRQALISSHSMDRDLLIKNIVSVARLAKTFGLPVVLSTINVANGAGATVPELRDVLADSPEIDRTSINSWEDTEFRRAVEATGRKKLIMTALWTEVCLAFPALDAMRGGFEVYPVVDAAGGTSAEAHRAGLERIVQAGAQPVGWVSLACELQRDWARMDTVAEVRDIVLTSRLLKEADQASA
jgi:nicotinamidase-related amidase